MKEKLQKIDKITSEFKGTFGALTPEQLNRKPDPNSWSIAQNIEHLIVINETYEPIIESVRNGTIKLPFISKFGFVVNFFGKAILKAVSPESKSKVKTFPKAQPSETEIGGDIIQRFENHQAKLKKMMENSEDLIRKNTIISSPANKNIVYKLDTAFDIIIAHEHRHFEQAKGVLKKMNLQ